MAFSFIHPVGSEILPLQFSVEKEKIICIVFSFKYIYIKLSILHILIGQQCLLVVDPIHQIGFCRIPKVASTSWLAKLKILKDGLNLNKTFSYREEFLLHSQSQQ